jgi:hypothetical protein
MNLTTRLTLAQSAKALSERNDELRWLTEFNVCCEEMAQQLYDGDYISYLFNEEVKKETINIVWYDECGGITLIYIDYCPFCGQKIILKEDE